MGWPGSPISPADASCRPMAAPGMISTISRLVGRALSALFDAGSVLLAGLIARRLAGRWAAVLAAAFVAVIPFEMQVSHFYAVDTVLLFFVLLTLWACVLLVQAAGAPARHELSVAGQWWAWRLGVLLGLAFGLAVATKVSALPLLRPSAWRCCCCWRRRGLDAALLALLGIVSTGLIVYTLVSPYAFIDWREFQPAGHRADDALAGPARLSLRPPVRGHDALSLSAAADAAL